MEKELTLLVGVQFVGKKEFLQKHFYGTPVQIISYDHIQAVMQASGNNDYRSMMSVITIMTKSFMSQGLPVVVCGLNIANKAVQSWRNVCDNFQYKLKVILFDAEKDKIFKVLEDDQSLNEENKNAIQTNIDMYEELKVILNLKHQKMVDEVIFAKDLEVEDQKLEEKGDEIL